ncbi:MAG: glycogen/starch/alpha-glucan phosphorylase [Candidatus Limiplasma sp.]|nr:glycogen/starch/alpha-glucan phosphorylase [Candidatus Limiplasma sp.]
MNQTLSLREAFHYELASRFQVTAEKAGPIQLHSALSRAVMGLTLPAFERSMQDPARRAYYLSAEFLIGRSIFNNLYNLGLYEEAQELLAQAGHSLGELEEIEDAALGNGGLGRLAACYLESAATLDLPLDGYGIRYKYGLFKQSFADGFQVEAPDDWQRCLDPWSVRKEEDAVRLRMSGKDVLAVPYDMPTFGYRSRRVGRLRLWQCEALEPFDFAVYDAGEYDHAVRERTFADTIHMVLYPNDNSKNGKALRLMQEYFFCAASVRDILREYKRSHGEDLGGLPEYVSIQLNDTHPVVAIPELLRILTGEGGMDFDRAFDIVSRIFNYTNHTIMQEALEKWDVALFRKVLPELMPTIRRIQRKLNHTLNAAWIPKGEQGAYAVMDKGTLNMANLACFAGAYVNGVAELHTQLLKTDVLAQWYRLYPQRFQNKTNGVTQRRWLGLCNPELTAFLAEALGSDAFLTDPQALQALAPIAREREAQERFNRIKHEKKRQLAEYIAQKEGIRLNPEAVFDVQIKRLHEYKRQFMAALSILYLYFGLKDGSITDVPPMAFLFGAKSAPGYFRAKAVIKLLNEIGRLVNGDPDVNRMLSVVFVQNYNVSYAEKIIPAADISEQISTAGTEASGTGNMKLMLNGAVTLGTYDGANIEIFQEAGEDNNRVFGARVEEIREMGESYNPMALYEGDPKIKRVMDALVDGTLSDSGTGMFQELYDALLKGASWHRPDHYYVLLDLVPYVQAKLELARLYPNRLAFAQMALRNIAAAGKFSSDRAVAQYAREIWGIEPLSRA